MNENVIFIGARGGSQRIPHKNIKILGDFPLISWSILSGVSLGYPIYVSTDCPLTGKISQQEGAIYINRPSKFAQNDSLDIDWIRDLLDQLDFIPKLIILLRPTTPFRNINILKNAIRSFNPIYSSLKSVELMKENIQKAYHVKDNILIPAYPFTEEEISLLGEKDPTILPNQIFEDSYMANGYIDILKPEIILEEDDLYGPNPQAFITPRTVDIDDEYDFKMAELYLKCQNI